MKSIVFVLGKALRVLEINPDVNEVTELAVLLKQESGYLDLADRFEGIFKSLDTTHYDQFSLILLQNAGFTDSRIVYLWLKGESIFDGKNVAMYKTVEELELQTYQDFEDFFGSHTSTKNLEYSREPSIGKK
jgi:hypothetical protein